MRNLLLMFLAIFFVSSVNCFGLSKVPEPKLSDLATSWLGGSPQSTLEYFRLELDESGRGILVVQYLPGYPASLYEVSSTKLNGYKISFEVQAMDSGAEPIFLRGEALPFQLNLEVGGVERTWKKKIILEKEARVLERIQVVTERAVKVRQSQHTENLMRQNH